MLSRYSVRAPVRSVKSVLASRHAVDCTRRLQSTYSAQSPAPRSNTDYLQVTHPDDAVPQQVQDRLAKYASVSLATYARPPFILTRGKGCTVWDSIGREYLDFSGGIAVNALGHADQGVQQIVAEQAGLLVHNSNLWHNEWAGELALMLVNKTKQFGGLGYAPTPLEDIPTGPSPGLKVFFSNSGTEANEGALKFARKWGKGTTGQKGNVQQSSDKVEIVSFRDGFHGRSLGALSATWQEKYQKPFEPLIPSMVPATLNDIEALQTVITDKTCGVIVEPIQGEGGILEASEDFLRALRKRCDEVGALLIFDEIQCGIGRTGSLWAHGSMPVDCHPDILTMAKPLANGVPMGAIMMKDKVAEIIKIGDHGTTFGGGPLQTRVAHHVLGRIAQPEFLSNVASLGEHLKSRLDALPDLFPRLVMPSPTSSSSSATTAGRTSIRGRGLILGIPFREDKYAAQVLKLARERGLLILTCGKATVRLVPSLTCTHEEVEKCCDVLESCLIRMNSMSEGM